MKTFTIPHLKGASAAIAIAASLALAGCNAPNTSSDGNSTVAAALPALPPTLPLAAGDATPINPAPAAAALPDARPVKLVRVADSADDYAYADDAAGFTDAIGDAPPDYGFDYEDSEPWAWQGYDDSVTFAEPLDDGYRYYYYRPGADEPYFVRDPDYGYGYSDGGLAVVYGPDGAIIPYADYGPRVTYASRYYARGRDMWRASRERQRRAVIASNWAARQQTIQASRTRWTQDRQRQQAWNTYHDRVAGQQANHWQEEQARRRADTVRFADWRRQDFRTPPPPRAIPADWTKQSWARDTTRFAPPARGFNGDAQQRERAATEERARLTQLDRREQQQAQRPPALDRQRAEAAQRQAQAQASAAQRKAQAAHQADAARQGQQDRQVQARQQQQTRATQQRAATAQRATAQTAAKAKMQADAQSRVQARAGATAQARARADAVAQTRHAQATQAQARQRANADTAARARAEQADRTRAAQSARAGAQAAQREQVQAHQQAQATQRAQAQREQGQARQQAQAAQRAQAHAQAAQRQAVERAAPPPRPRPVPRAQPAARPAPARSEPRPQPQAREGGPARARADHVR